MQVREGSLRAQLTVTDDVRRAALDAGDGTSVTRTRAITAAVLDIVTRDLNIILEHCTLVPDQVNGMEFGCVEVER